MSYFCLLTEPLLPVEIAGTRVWRTLPGLLADLAVDRVDDIPDLGPHQHQTFYQFLAQLAALALALQAGADEAVPPDTPLPDDAESWQRLLLALAPAPAWTLVHDAIGEPAFLQPPIPEGTLDGFDPLADTADGIETLVTGRAVDVKPARAVASRPHHWVYALVSLQTSMGYLGRGNFGIARMNGGFSSRPMLELAPASMRWGARLRRVMPTLLRVREALLCDDDMNKKLYTPNGEALLWLAPWDGKEAAPAAGLEPHFIEICRRVRLILRDGAIAALGRPTDGARLNAKERAGLLGDPWMPIDRKAAKAITFQAGAFGYRRLAHLLTDFEGQGITLPPAALMHEDEKEKYPDEPLVFHASVLIRGQGGTEGLETRTLPITAKAALCIWENQETPNEALRRLCAVMLDNARRAVDALCGGLAMALQHHSVSQGGKLNYSASALEPGREALERAIDGFFFDHLWQQLGAEEDARETTDRAWRQQLYDDAKRIFERELERLPTDAVRIGPARAAAQNLFFGLLKKHLPMPEADDAAGEEMTDDDTNPDAAL